MLMRIVILLLMLVPVPASAGLHAVYGARHFGNSIEIRVADNGDFVAATGTASGVVRKGGETFLIEGLFTGPRVTRLADLTRLVAERAPPEPHSASAPANRVSRGAATVNGRTGEAFVFPALGPSDRERGRIVVSRDPALAPLGPALREVWRARMYGSALRYTPMRSAADLEETLAGLLPPGTALLEGDELVLLSAEPASIAAESIALPAEPETPEVLRARMKELADEAPGRMTNIARGAFSEGRLWLLTEDGQVASMADGGGPLQREALGAKVVDLCSGARGLAAVTGERRQGRGWSLMRRSGGRWIEEASVARTGDGAIALSCEGEAESLLTTSRFITFAAGRPRVLALAETLPLALVTAAVHVTPAAVFLGINAGEWGGGLRRIDRATGRVATIERKEGEGACRLPLDAACDPVNAIATPPWRTDCVVAAVGLVHMMASGRLLSVCGGTVELLFAAPLDPHLADREDARRAAKGGIGSVPFYGLVTRGPDLVAVGHDALYVVGKNGTAVRQPFPRFRLIDGVYVTFDVPGAILVLTEISRRASLSGGAPMLVQRP